MVKKKETNQALNRELPLEIILPLLKPERIEKLKQYVAKYILEEYRLKDGRKTQLEHHA